MPSSRPDHLPSMAYMVNNLKPKSILDLGIGSGFKGAFFREYTDVWDHGVIDPSDGIYLVGIEAFEEYYNPLWKQYSEVIIGDIRKLDELTYGKYYPSKFREASFDIVHCGDVIEHLTKEEGLLLVENMKRIALKAAIIVTPVKVLKQGTVFGNPLERHVSEWNPNDFPGFSAAAWGNVAMYTWRRPGT